MAAQQFFNQPKTLVAEALEGMAAAHPRHLRWVPSPGYLVRTDAPTSGKVGLVSGGGSGHEPLHTGFVGSGLLDAACPGAVFASPNALQIRGATRAVHSDAGVLHVVKNYTGDVLNFRIAADLVSEDGIPVESVLVADDVATDTGDQGPGRRGTGAVVAVEKICGAAAEAGMELTELAALGQRVAESSRSMALALHACTHPGRDRPSFDLPDGEVEFGVGIHGERGRKRIPMAPASELVEQLSAPVIESLGLTGGERVIAIVNGLGSTHQLELNLLFGQLQALLGGHGIDVERNLVGTMVSALDMAGVSITLVRADDEMLRYWDAPATAPGWPSQLGSR
ncbi:dihydroxyacetone kinase subunit DhaK [Parasphingorhabdus pacifica]